MLNDTILATVTKGTTAQLATYLAFSWIDTSHVLWGIISFVIAVLTVWKLILDVINANDERKDNKRHHHKHSDDE